jgi:hypothetical protein
MDFTLAGFILSAVIAVVGWVYALIVKSGASNDKLRATELINLAQTVTQERVERIAGEKLLTALLDSVPERTLLLEQGKARTDANVDILMKSYEKNVLSK